MPEDAEVLGLLALMEIQASRLRAHTGPDGAGRLAGALIGPGQRCQPNSFGS